VPTLRSTIETDIGNWLDRTDLSTNITTWFELAHREIQRDQNYPPMQAVPTDIAFVASTDSYTEPTDLKEIITAFKYDTSTSKVDFFYTETDITTVRAYRAEHQDVSDPENLWEGRMLAWWNSKLELWPPVGTTVANKVLRLDIYKFIDSPASGASDWFTNNARDYLLFRSLMYSAPFLAADTRLEIWKEQMREAKLGLTKLAVLRRTTSGPLQMRG